MAERICSIPDCNKSPVFARGWCRMHWNRWRRHGDPVSVLTEQHGLSRSAEYAAWKHLRGRCLNERDAAYDQYGGRGITVCERWRDSFSAFYADMGPRPSAGHSLDRIDNDGPYSPENCRWATHLVQSNNKQGSKYLTWQGETLTWAQWADRLGLDRSTIHYRVAQGWPVDRILSPRSNTGRPRRRS